MSGFRCTVLFLVVIIFVFTFLRCGAWGRVYGTYVEDVGGGGVLVVGLLRGVFSEVVRLLWGRTSMSEGCRWC